MFLNRSHTGFLKRQMATPEKAGFSAIRRACALDDFIGIHFNQVNSMSCHFFDGKPRLNPSQPVYFGFMTDCGLARLAPTSP
jgi:hypothetical protein